MRIGVITGEYPPAKGGVGDYSACIIGEWASMGYEVFLLARPSAHDDRPHVHLQNSVTQWGLSFIPTVRQWAKTHSLSLINLQYQTAIFDMSGVIHALPRLLPVPVVTTFHDMLPPYLFPKAGRVRHWVVDELARSSAQTVVTNHEDFARVRHLPHAHLIPIGSNIAIHRIDGHQRDTLRQGIGNGFIVGHFGFLYPNRGVEHLLQAIHDMVQVGHDVRLVFIGGREGGPAQPAYVAQLDAQIQRLGLHGRVHWLGYLDAPQVSAWLQSIDVLALPFLDGASYRRGSLMAGIEHGCAIVTTQPAVTIPTFQDSQNMSLVPIGNAPALAAALTHLYESPETRLHYQKSITALRSTFQWPSIARQFETVFESLHQ